jgi:hypothetical protein
MSIDAALDRLQAALAAAGHPDYGALTLSPVAPGEVEAAEAALGVKLPPAYVDLVTRRGSFAIRGTSGAVYNPLLSPAEMARYTLRAREAYADDEPEVAEALEDLLFFQGNLYHDNFYAFVVSTREPNGEMSIDTFYHDEPYEPWERAPAHEVSDPSPFQLHIVELVENWIAKLKA